MPWLTVGQPRALDQEKARQTGLFLGSLKPHQSVRSGNLVPEEAPNCVDNYLLYMLFNNSKGPNTNKNTNKLGGNCRLRQSKRESHSSKATLIRPTEKADRKPQDRRLRSPPAPALTLEIISA
ncbi:hypothetical protein [Mesorhizobium sp. M0019]|uniref:hypothetical protein n=1 Tax=Mesorhizobium sp. M0019 TaxID=2956845 RepID=UPI0033399F14